MTRRSLSHPRRAPAPRRPRLWALLAVVLFALPLMGAGRLAVRFAPSAGLFSWKASLVNEADGRLFDVMEQQGLNMLFQNISTKHSRQAQIAAFLEEAAERDIRVYQLTGDPSWALDKKGGKLCEAVELAAAHNRRTEKEFRSWRKEDGKPWTKIPRLSGIVFDVEPYALDQWDENPDKVMKSFVSGMKKAYALAKEYSLEVIICIPWHYDTSVQEELLEELIRDGCDSAAVMNYYRGQEIEHIAVEARLAAGHGKELITIYELQEADGKSLKDINTYHDQGLDAVRENYKQLCAAYGDQTVSMALHSYEALLELLDDE